MNNVFFGHFLASETVLLVLIKAKIVESLAKFCAVVKLYIKYSLFAVKTEFGKINTNWEKDFLLIENTFESQLLMFENKT